MSCVDIVYLIFKNKKSRKKVFNISIIYSEELIWSTTNKNAEKRFFKQP